MIPYRQGACNNSIFFRVPNTAGDLRNKKCRDELNLKTLQKSFYRLKSGDEVLRSISEVNKVNEKLANPASLGLLGFGMTTVLLNLHNAGFYPLNSMILAMGLAYGGLAQVIAGIMEYRKGNTFGTVAFSSYGLFWWSLVLLLVLPRFEIFDLSASSPLQATNSTAMAAYFFMWGLFTFIMFFGTLKTNRLLQFVFLSLAVLFFLLTAKELTGSTNLGIITGYEGIICGLSAVYTALAEVLNEVYGETVLPLFPTNKG